MKSSDEKNLADNFVEMWARSYDIRGYWSMPIGFWKKEVVTAYENRPK